MNTQRQFDGQFGHLLCASCVWRFGASLFSLKAHFAAWLHTLPRINCANTFRAPFRARQTAKRTKGRDHMMPQRTTTARSHEAELATREREFPPIGTRSREAKQPQILNPR